MRAIITGMSPPSARRVACAIPMKGSASFETSPPTTDVMRVEQLCKRFGSRQVVAGVSFRVGAGEVVGLLGANGAGKTTTFRMATGLIRPDAGTVDILGRGPLDAHRHSGTLTMPGLTSSTSAPSLIASV